jgi:hypothetical protein
LPRKFLIPILAVVAVIALFTGAAFAWDQASSNKVAPGVDVAGVEIGGQVDGVLARLNQIIGSYGGANYSDTRPTDVSTVRAVLPTQGTPQDAARAGRWAKIQDLLRHDS